MLRTSETPHARVLALRCIRAWLASCRFRGHFGKALRNIFLQMLLIPFHGQHIVGPFRANLSRDLLLTAHRIDGNNAPLISNTSNSFGIAVISFVFSSTATCPKSNRFSVAHALTTCNGFLPLARSRLAGKVLPSMPDDLPAAFPGAPAPNRRNSEEVLGIQSAKHTMKVSVNGNADDQIQVLSSQACLLFPNFPCRTNRCPLIDAHRPIKSNVQQTMNLGSLNPRSSMCHNGKHAGKLLRHSTSPP